MRSLTSLLLILALVAVCSAAGSSYQGSRNKARTIRGFKNVALSTARGFGKRDGALEFLAAPATSSEQLPERIPDSFPVDWFVEELQNNPDLARIIVHKFVDANQDGELSPEELLRPLY
ncbi:allatotropins [Anabrus simplex]|uniref:allatotropins n=1 Tax=Anabrus simplex TaxID=316456 RepID=UPI0034DDA6D2